MWEGRLHRIGASAGITMINEHNCQLTEVMSQADIACYAAKNSGRGRLTVYEPQHALTSSKGMMPLEEQWHMIKNNHLLMLARNVAPPRTPEATSFGWSHQAVDQRRKCWKSARSGRVSRLRAASRA